MLSAETTTGPRAREGQARQGAPAGRWRGQAADGPLGEAAGVALGDRKRAALRSGHAGARLVRPVGRMRDRIEAPAGAAERDDEPTWAAQRGGTGAGSGEKDDGHGDDPAYRQRVERTAARLTRTGVAKRRVAREIGRSERCVYEVLSLAVPGRPTVALIETWLDAHASAAPSQEVSDG